jgi:hypothetical protein
MCNLASHVQHGNLRPPSKFVNLSSVFQKLKLNSEFLRYLSGVEFAVSD